MKENKNNKVKNNENLIKMLCYMGIFILAIFIILPPLFRLVFPEEEKEEEVEEVIVNLNCVRIEDFIEYELMTTIDTNYINGIVSESTFTYEIEYIEEIFGDEAIIIEEYEALKSVGNVDFVEEENVYTLKINYDNFDYSEEELLLQHQQTITQQLEYYTNNFFECETTSVQ